MKRFASQNIRYFICRSVIFLCLSYLLVVFVFRFGLHASTVYSNSLAAGPVEVGSEVQRVPGKNVQRCTPAVQRGHVRD